MNERSILLGILHHIKYIAVKFGISAVYVLFNLLCLFF